jgi:hypothetical protein
MYQYKIKELYIKLVIEASLYYDARSEKHKIIYADPGQRFGFAADSLMRSWVGISPGARMYVSCECCVLSGRGFCAGLITCK